MDALLGPESEATQTAFGFVGDNVSSRLSDAPGLTYNSGPQGVVLVGDGPSSNS